MRLSERAASALLGRKATREDAYAARVAAKQSRPKYGNHQITTDAGTRFDSKAEYRRWCALELLQRAGEITELQRQVPYMLVPEQKAPDGTKLRPVMYLADMVYRDGDGTLVVEDVKGVATSEYRIKRKLMLMVHGIWVKEIRT